MRAGVTLQAKPAESSGVVDWVGLLWIELTELIDRLSESRWLGGLPVAVLGCSQLLAACATITAMRITAEIVGQNAATP